LTTQSGRNGAASPADPAIPPAGIAPPLARLERRLAGTRGWRRAGLAAVLGALAAAALPPVHAVIALVPAFVGLVWLIESGSRRRAFADGWWFGFGHFVAGLYWVGSSMLVQPERYAVLIPFAVSGLAAVVALFPAAAALATRALAGVVPRGAGRILVFAALWTVFEWARSWVLTGFPWNLLGTVWTVSDAMIQAAALFGVYGLSLLTAAAAAMPALLVNGGTGSRPRATPVVIAFAVLVVVWGGGAARLMTADDATVPGVRLRLVQGNIEQALKWRPNLRQGHVDKQLRLSALPPRTSGREAPDTTPPAPTHIVWSETAVPFFLGRDQRHLAMIGAVTPPGGVTIVGAPRTTPKREATFRVWNSLLAVDARGRVVDAYDKVHLVPFGEYIPFGRLLRITKLTAGRADFSPGPGFRSLRLPGLPPVSPLICYEIIFPGRVTDPLDRPEWLLNITNDGWFGRTSGPYQHLAAARIRAVEEGLPLVRVANTGVSAVVDAYGRTVASLGLGSTGVIDSALPGRPGGFTLYGRLGDWTLLLMVLAVAGAGIFSPRTRTI
jgi:apolipoprotein N-acyltransferase